MTKYFSIIVLLIILTGCTRFEVVWPDGTRVERSGGFLVNADSHFKVWHEWIEEIEDPDSGELLQIPHIVTIEQETFEDTGNQVSAIDSVIAALERAYGVARQPGSDSRSRINRLPSRRENPAQGTTQNFDQEDLE